MVLLVLLIGAFIPRIVLFFMWLFNYTRFDLAYSNFIIPFIGFLILPYTTLMYVFVYDPVQGLSGWGWLWMILAVFVDLSSYSWGAYKRAYKSQSEEVVEAE